MARVMVYPFERHDISSDQSPSIRYGTLEAIRRMHGAKPIMNKGVEIDEDELDPDLPGTALRDFKP
jgi:hypothetical protein